MKIFKLISFIILLFLCLTTSASANLSTEKTKNQIDEISQQTTNTIIRYQRSDGKFRDPIGKEVGIFGLNRMNYALLNQINRGENLDKVDTVNKIFYRGIEGNNLVAAWPLTMIFSDQLDNNFDQTSRDYILNRIINYEIMSATGVAKVCYQKPGCYNNYHLLSAAVNSEIILIKRNYPNFKSGNSKARSNTVTIENNLQEIYNLIKNNSSGSMNIYYKKYFQRGRIISDPPTYPLAYHALSLSLLSRIVDNYSKLSLTGNNLKIYNQITKFHKQALWATLAVTAPSSETTWMGRGQDVLWTLAANLYSATVANNLYYQTDKRLTAQLNNLVLLQLSAVKARTTNFVIFPNNYNGHIGYAGLDSYSSYIGNSSFTLVYLELALNQLNNYKNTKTALTVSQQNNHFIDKTIKLAGLGYNNNWLGINLKEQTNDRRHGFGVLKALSKTNNGWKSLKANFPVSRRHQTPPSSYPILIHNKKKYYFHYNNISFKKNKAIIRGKWKNKTRILKTAKIEYNINKNLTTSVSCIKNSKLSLNIWLENQVRYNQNTLSTKNFSLKTNVKFKLKKYKDKYSSSRQPVLYAYNLTFDCKKNIKLVNSSNKILLP